MIYRFIGNVLGLACAWLLWQEATGLVGENDVRLLRKDSREWMVVKESQTLDSCEEALAATVDRQYLALNERAKAQMPDGTGRNVDVGTVIKSENVISFRLNKSGLVTMMFYHCFPGNIDPRH